MLKPILNDYTIVYHIFCLFSVFWSEIRRNWKGYADVGNSKKCQSSKLKLMINLKLNYVVIQQPYKFINSSVS